MLKRCSLVLITMGFAIAALLIAAQHSIGENAISYDQPMGLVISIGIVVFLFLPPLILSLFDNPIGTYINAAYQFFIVLSFIGMIPIGFMISNGFLMTVVSILGTITSAFTLFILLRNGTMQRSQVER